MIQGLGLISIILSWVAGILLVTKWRQERRESISQHAASQRSAALLFASTLILVGSIFYLWLIFWFSPRLGLGIIFNAVITATFLAQIVVGLIPDKKGWKRSVHRGAAYFMATLYIPLAIYIFNAVGISPISKFVAAVSIIYMLLAAASYALLPRTHRYFFVFQSLYILAFQLTILSAAYL